MLDALRDVSAPCMLYLFGVWLCRIVLVFLFLLYLIIVILVLNFAPIVHPQYTRVGYFFLNKFFSLPIKKEKKDHLVLHCSVASNLCSFVFTLFRVSWAMPKRFCFFFLLQLYTSSVTWYCYFLFFINKFYFLKKKRVLPKARFRYWIVGKEIWIIVGI